MERAGEPQTSGITLERASPAPSASAEEQCRLTRLRYLVASAYGTDRDALTRRHPGALEKDWPRSVAIAIARQILMSNLSVLARHFGCTGAAEVMAHINLVSQRARSNPRTRIAFNLLAGTCASALGLGQERG